VSQKNQEARKKKSGPKKNWKKRKQGPYLAFLEGLVLVGRNPRGGGWVVSAGRKNNGKVPRGLM